MYPVETDQGPLPMRLKLRDRLRQACRGLPLSESVLAEVTHAVALFRHDVLGARGANDVYINLLLCAKGLLTVGEDAAAERALQASGFGAYMQTAMVARLSSRRLMVLARMCATRVLCPPRDSNSPFPETWTLYLDRVDWQDTDSLELGLLSGMRPLINAVITLADDRGVPWRLALGGTRDYALRISGRSRSHHHTRMTRNVLLRTAKAVANHDAAVGPAEIIYSDI